MSNGSPPDCPPDPGCSCPPGMTLCDGDTKNNVWVERGTPGAIGICLLNTMSEAQIIHVLERDERARADLLRVTTNPRLLQLARETPRLPLAEEADQIQTDVNRNAVAASNAFYGIFRGQPPFSQ